MDIRILPSNIANMIAAGEVVQRPASVVKELMENALDAGADQVTVVIQDAGRTLIQVIDNGCGMSPDEAVLCFERHATSKIATAEDLMNIHTFGFRGEALASIAAVAEVTLRTRREGDEVGCEVRFADSNHISTEEAAVPRGANFAVRNLFYNVPARRKFLKSDNVEFKHILSEFTRVALTRPDAGFTLVHNGKEVFVLKPAKSLKFRIQDLTGPNVVNELVDISADTSVVKVSGYIGRPDMARKSLGNQYMFVNGRYFKSPYLNRAVLKGYEHLITEGTTPSYFIWLEADPRTLDVNISPTKTEVKFEDDSVIFQILYACIKESLGKNSFVASIDFDREGAPEIHSIRCQSRCRRSTRHTIPLTMTASLRKIHLLQMCFPENRAHQEGNSARVCLPQENIPEQRLWMTFCHMEIYGRGMAGDRKRQQGMEAGCPAMWTAGMTTGNCLRTRHFRPRRSWS